MKVFSDAQIEILKRVLLEVVGEQPVPRSVIFDRFEELANSRFEMYKFNRALSELIRTDKITGYNLKQGRSGGVIRTQNIERVELICSMGRYIGTVSSSQLDEILSYLSENH